MTVLHLRHQRPDGDIDLYHLKGVRPYTVGRGSGCEVRILDMKMSRTHLRLEEREQGWLAVDLGSTNGVMLDGVRIDREAPLRPGCALAMGGTVLEVVAITPHLDLDGDEIRSSALAVSAATESVTLPEQPPLPDITEDVPLPRPGVESAELEPTAARTPVPTPPPQPAASGANDATVAYAPNAAAPTGRTGLYITLLGRRIGPIPRDVARDLKARELRGTLQERDLDGLPGA